MSSDNRERGKALSRREFLAGTAAALAGAAVGSAAGAQEQKPVTIGTGRFTYTLVEGWGAPPPGMTFKFGCGVVVDSKDRVYVHSNADKTMVVYDRDGKIVNDWGAEFAAKGHGLYHWKDGADEYLFWSILGPFHQVLKTDLNGKVLMRIGNVAEENSTSIKFPFNMPTDVAIAPNGDIYVCEGYGGNKVHRFTKEGKFVQTIGEPGTGPGQFKTCHGIWVDTRLWLAAPELYIADRNNHRLQVFTLEGKLKREIREGIRQPCCFYQHRGLLFIPDLDKVVTVIGREDKVIAQLGDGKAITGSSAFQRPHALTLDSHGDLYVVEWVPDARLRKFKHTPAQG